MSTDAGSADEPPEKRGREQGDRFTEADDAQTQFEEIEKAQRKIRQGKLRGIIDSIKKSKQRAANDLRRMRAKRNPESDG